MRCRRAGWAALVALLLLTASACGGDTQRPLRIGVVVDCVGGWRALGDGELAAAQLPLIARGARTVGENPSDGLRGGRVAGRRVEIVRGCSESGEFSTLTQVARQLVEREHVDAVVAGGFDPVDGIPLREVARRYPDVVFVAAASGPREVTLDRPAGNLYRVAPDYGQGVAGLATYAYRRLGWRRVAILPEEWVAGWGAETAFVREFCALGGRVANRVPLQDPGRAGVRGREAHPARRRRCRRARVVGVRYPRSLARARSAGDQHSRARPGGDRRTPTWCVTSRRSLGSWERRIRLRRGARRRSAPTCASTPRRIPARHRMSRATRS